MVQDDGCIMIMAACPSLLQPFSHSGTAHSPASLRLALAEDSAAPPLGPRFGAAAARPRFWAATGRAARPRNRAVGRRPGRGLKSPCATRIYAPCAGPARHRSLPWASAAPADAPRRGPARLSGRPAVRPRKRGPAGAAAESPACSVPARR